MPNMPIPQYPDMASYLRTQSQNTVQSPWTAGVTGAQQMGQFGQLEELLKKLPRSVLFKLLQGDMDKTLNGAQFNQGVNQQQQLMRENGHFRGDGRNGMQWDTMPGAPGFGRYM